MSLQGSLGVNLTRQEQLMLHARHSLLWAITLQMSELTRNPCCTRMHRHGAPNPPGVGGSPSQAFPSHGRLSFIS